MKRRTPRPGRAADRDAQVEAEIEACSGVLTRALDSYLEAARAEIDYLRAQLAEIRAARKGVGP